METYPNEAAVLQALGRPSDQGWSVVGRTMEVKDQSVKDPDTGAAVNQPVPTGNYVWVLSGPNGQTDSIKVHPTTDPNSPNKGGIGYTVTAPPSRALNQTPPPPKDGDTRPNVNGGYQVQEVYKGNQWVTDPNVKPIPFTPETASRPDEGAKRTTVDNGYQVGQIYQNGAWVTDPSVKPIAWSPSAQREGQLPNKGDTRTNVNGGYAVQEVYDGNAWTVDTSKPPVPYTPEAQKSATQAANAPNKGDKRQTIDGGYNVGQVYDGTAWINDPSVTPVPVTGAAKTSEASAANLPKQGDKRMAPDNGFLVPQVYSQGTWIPDTSPGAAAPTRYLPQTPTTVQTSADAPNIAERDANGNLVWSPNKNYMPTDPALRAAQLQQQARDQANQLQSQVKAQAISPDQANQQFQQWWQTNVEPQRAAITNAQQQQAFKNQTDAAATTVAQLNAATQAQTAAGGVGKSAADIAMQMMPYRVGPGYANAVNQIAGSFASGKMPGNIDIGNAVTYNLPADQDPTNIYKQQTAAALAHLSPTAAGIAGMPPPQIPQSPDLNAGFNMNQYMPPGGFAGGPPPAGGGGAATTTAAATPASASAAATAAGGAPPPPPAAPVTAPAQWGQYSQFTPGGMQPTQNPFNMPGMQNLPWQTPYQLPPGFPA